MTHADLDNGSATLTHADLRQIVERAHIEAAFMSEAPACFRLAATDGEWRVFRRLLLNRTSEALLDQQAEHLGDLLFNGVDKDRACKLTLANCTIADESRGELSEERLLLVRAREHLNHMEWSNTRRGPGSGPMFSGGDGTPYPACPCCGGLREPNGDFTAEAVGHRPNCALSRLLLDLDRHLNSPVATSDNSSTPTTEG